MAAVVVTTKTLYFIMVMRGTWTRVGNPYPSRESANEWKPFVRSAWRGMRTKVERCVIELHEANQRRRASSSWMSASTWTSC